MESDMIVLTSTPESGISELVEGARALRASDIILLVPLEAIEEDNDVVHDGHRSAKWQHPEAWLGSVTSVKGSPMLGEEVRIHARQISRFGSDVEQQMLGGSAANSMSSLAIGRQYGLFFIAMETPLCRQIAAVRCLSQVRMPPWSEGFEGKRPSYKYSDALRKLLLAPAEIAAEEALTVVDPAGRSATDTLNALEAEGRHMWLACLSPSQRTALEKALTERFSMIQGPPGTGKTYVACAIIAAWVARSGWNGQRVLAVADSNVAADNIHTRLQQFGVDSARIGQKGDQQDQLTGDALRRAAMTALPALGAVWRL
jgi:hypothetical protein